jgi:hypothetical protein
MPETGFGLLYAIRYKDIKNAIDGKLSVDEVVNIDCDNRIGTCDELLPCETFLYWEVSEPPDYVIVQNKFKVRGFLEKIRLKVSMIQKQLD